VLHHALGALTLFAVVAGVALLYALLAIPLSLVARLVRALAFPLFALALVCYALPRLIDRLGSLF
jgi:hypothetical protein